MKTLRNQKGFTMVEVIIAAVMLVTVAVALLGLYGNNFGWIVGAGYRMKALDEARTEMDSQIASGAPDDSTDSLSISFPGASTITVMGKYLQTTGTDGPGGSVSVMLDSFIPR
ncbi:MAG TPA: prepilin-type N-terminal cleavage/methylation domain-containing protein [Bacillota bacterium]|nr:prepilin-type N-terminal cleavage/methylation domain-containing protein [Bacillota bacterium]HPM63329.1 prepilin-type N-terminal cleavage/methylation domain-containing protein [Bacillota bacterium]